MKEIWKDIKGYEGLYKISNLGKVLSCEKKWKCGRNTIRTKDAGLMKISKDQRGYPLVQLYKDGKFINRRVHVLVWDTFGDSKRDGRRLNIDHIDENKENNSIQNLQVLKNRDNKIKGLITDRKSTRLNSSHITIS